MYYMKYVVILTLIFLLSVETFVSILKFEVREQGFPDETWVPVTHFMISADHIFDTTWNYYNPKSNLEFYLGKSIIFKSHEDVNKYFDENFDNLVNKHSISIETITQARKHFDSIQITKHDKDPDKIPKFEIIDLQQYHKTIKIGKIGIDKNIKTMQHYRNKYSKKWEPFPKFVISSCAGPNYELQSK